MENVLHFRQPTLTKSTFDLEFQEEKLYFDVGYQNEKVIIFWHKKLENEESEISEDMIVYEKEITLNKFDRFISKLVGRDKHSALKKKTLRCIRKAQDDFRRKVILQDNMDTLITEIMDAGQLSLSQTKSGS